MKSVVGVLFLFKILVPAVVDFARDGIVGGIVGAEALADWFAGGVDVLDEGRAFGIEVLMREKKGEFGGGEATDCVSVILSFGKKAGGAAVLPRRN